MGVSKENSQIAGSGVAILLGALFYVYVGTEVSTSYWAATHAQRAAVWATNTYTLAPTFFFAGLLGGRGLVPRPDGRPVPAHCRAPAR